MQANLKITSNVFLTRTPLYVHFGSQDILKLDLPPNLHLNLLIKLLHKVKETSAQQAVTSLTLVLLSLSVSATI